ncbi:uncharacterized protein LTR77_003241 [Saxophila tyrrhenica]|uniref:MARVEL domain-containing protein n=1 Tax=Saxophila tyrrhenica TaxID=1690608 RepID=A0AAV9PJN1_9PEZI|nr:hypothetical protein LTR77_003241 [Saxophila tyrrhenica]
MAYIYNNPPPHYGPTTDIHLKPIPYAQTSTLSLGSNTSYYKPIVPSPSHSDLDLQDAKLKHRIRLLRIVSRALATVLSAATVAPLAITLVKFFQTKDTYMTVDGESRTAWASGTIAWYTYMYFGISLVSFLLNAGIMISYIRGVKQANATAKYAGYWSALILGAHVVVWAISVAVYRYGKEPVEGKFVDLWGWTCSEAANEIQEQVTDIDFQQYCSIQTTSFFTGIANTVAGLLSAVIYLFAIMRMRSKKRAQQYGMSADPAREPLRQY